MLIGIDAVCLLVNRCIVYESLYLSGKDGPSDQARANLLNGLVNSYHDVLRFLATALSLFDAPTVSRAAHALFNPDEIMELITQLREAAQRVHIDADNCHKTCSADHQKNVQRQLDELVPPISVIQKQVNELWARSADDERKATLNWISNIPHANHHWLVCDQLAKGTGEWFLNRPEFIEWRTSAKSATLWLHGIREFCPTTISTDTLTTYQRI